MTADNICHGGWGCKGNTHVRHTGGAAGCAVRADGPRAASATAVGLRRQPTACVYGAPAELPGVPCVLMAGVRPQQRLWG